MSARIEALKGLLGQDPGNSRIRHMLANEYGNAGLVAEALGEYSALVEKDPDYVPGYFQAARLAESTGDIETARAWYQRGLETAREVGDKHAESEIAAALEMLD